MTSEIVCDTLSETPDAIAIWIDANALHNSPSFESIRISLSIWKLRKKYPLGKSLWQVKFDPALSLRIAIETDKVNLAQILTFVLLSVMRC
jgi:hypothetical protein